MTDNFLDATELKIEEAERAALIVVLAKLDAGELVHTKLYEAVDEPVPANGFNMSEWELENLGPDECGTVCCIAGWAERLAHVKFGASLKGNGDLDNLFFPAIDDKYIYFDPITPEQAAKALRNYLTTGKPSWEIVV